MILRFAILAVLVAGSLWPAPPLTTIQDVLYKADGTPFQGTAFIQWNSFRAADNSNIATQTVAVEIIAGNLRVQLVPTTNAVSTGAYYTVRYSSDGRIQFQETWAVPPSTTPLKLSAVRTSGPPGAVIAPPADTGTPIAESAVTGLVADLAARPEEGSAYTPSRVAFINQQGTLDGVSGSLSDCVHVDGSTGPCGASGPAFIDGETPAGVVNGSNATFTLANAPSPSTSLSLYRNGLLQEQGLDYNVNGAGITFLTASLPQPGDVLLASYRIGGSSPSSSTAPQVICGGAGIGTTATTLTQLASCTIPPALLNYGDRIEVRFDYLHTGTGTGFTIEAQWNTTVLVSRAAPASESLVSGRSDAVTDANGLQWNVQSWGGALSFVAGAGTASTSSPVVVALSANMSETTTDSIALRNFTIVRYPAQQ
jgi:hypothetical protein